MTSLTKPFVRRSRPQSGRRVLSSVAGVLPAALIGACATPQDVLLLNAARLPYALGDPRAFQIFNAPQPLRHPEVVRLSPPARIVCTLALNPAVAITADASGGLLDIRQPPVIDNADLQAALQRADGNPCPADTFVDAIHFNLRPGLVVGTPTTVGEARLRIGADIWTTPQGFFVFTLDRVDLSASPVRSSGTFKGMAERAGDPRLLLVEGSFFLRDFDFNGTFLP